MPASPLKEITFEVEGLPVPKGSLERKGKNLVAYRADDLRAWQSLVEWAARDEGWGTPCLGPVEIEVAFYLKRPARHHVGSNRANPLCDDAPAWPCRKPHSDLDKLTRPIGDALQGVC